MDVAIFVLSAVYGMFVDFTIYSTKHNQPKIYRTSIGVGEGWQGGCTPP